MYTIYDLADYYIQLWQEEKICLYKAAAKSRGRRTLRKVRYTLDAFFGSRKVSVLLS